MKVLTLISLFLCLVSGAWGQDPGKEAVARLRTVLLFGIDDQLAEVVPEAEVAGMAHASRLKSLKGLSFESYGLLGSDVQPVWRSYTNWSSPMKGSEEILLSFEPNSQAGATGVRLDLELWQSKRKVMKTTQSLRTGKWLYIAGPEWRSGRLIIGIELLPLVQP